MGGAVWRNLAGDLLLGLTFIKLQISQHAFIDFLNDNFGVYGFNLHVIQSSESDCKSSSAGLKWNMP